MWVPPTWEMSKHSIRTGSASSLQRPLEPVERLDALLAPALGLELLLVEREPRVALGQLEDAPLAAALGRADLDRAAAALAQQLGEHAELRALGELLLHDDQRRDRERARVVLEQELLGDDRAAPARPGCRGRTTGGPRARRRAPGRPARWPPSRRRRRRPRRTCRRLGGDPLALEQRRARRAAGCARAPPARSPARRAAKCIRRSRSRSIWRKRPDRNAITPSMPSRYSSCVDVADAGRPAALDVVVEARRARAAPRLGALAGAEQEDLAEQVERPAHALGARVRAEVGALAPVALAREVDAREVLVQADRDVRVGLVVAQPDVEARPVLLDEVLLGEQRLGLGVDDQRLDLVDERAEAAARAEMRGHALADRLGLADVDDAAAASRNR